MKLNDKWTDITTVKIAIGALLQIPPESFSTVRSAIRTMKAMPTFDAMHKQLLEDHRGRNATRPDDAVLFVMKGENPKNSTKTKKKTLNLDLKSSAGIVDAKDTLKIAISGSNWKHLKREKKHHMCPLVIPSKAMRHFALLLLCKPQQHGSSSVVQHLMFVRRDNFSTIQLQA